MNFTISSQFEMIFVIALIVGIIGFQQSFAQEQEFTEGSITWEQASYPIRNGTGTAKIIVTDSDRNEIPFFAEKVKVFVYSDSFPEGITLDLYETGKDTGIFERVFSLSDYRSAPSVLYARFGDTATATYTDDTLPLDSVYPEVTLAATTLIGSTGPPLERAPATNPRITDIHRKEIKYPLVGEQFLLTSDISNPTNKNQTFVWIAQITDSTNTVEALSWINGTLNPHDSFSPSTSWIPQRTGDYSVVFFVWKSITNPSALSPPIEMQFSVVNEIPQETTKEITIEIKDPINSKGLLPIVTTETTYNTETLDSVTDWNFLPLNHGEWGPLGDRLSWDTLPSMERINDYYGKTDGKKVEFETMFFRNDILRVYNANCQGERIEMLSADPIQIDIPQDLSSVSVVDSESGLLPVDGLYTLRFASFFEHEIILPDNAVIVSSEQKRCAVDHDEFPSGTYDKIVFKLEVFPEDFEFKYLFGVGEKNSYDSETEIYVKDMVCDDSITTTVPLTETEKGAIWKAIEKNNFFDMKDFTENCDEFGNCILVEPETRTTLTVIGNGMEHSVHFRDSYVEKSSKSFSEFMKIIDTITGIFEDKEELKFLPKPRCGYL